MRVANPRAFGLILASFLAAVCPAVVAQQTGSLQVTISPAAAVAAGAQWRVDGGAWQNSDQTVSNLAVGSHTVEFGALAGWVKPEDQTVQIDEDQTTLTSGTYTAPLVISEFMASNSSNPPLEAGELLDEDGDSSDWIEIYNPTDTTVSLAGWYLTDDGSDLTKWQFPAAALDPGGFLAVFASGKDRAVAGSELHTNFRLDADNPEYLALVATDGLTIAHEYAPQYPAQLANISYGLAQHATTLVGSGSTASYHVPGSDDAGTDWAAVDFDDSDWDTAPAGLGFAGSPAVESRDIGSPTAAGSYASDGDTYTVVGDGADIWGTADSFHYVYVPLTGDGEMTVRVVSLTNTDQWAKAGVMIRETLDAGAANAMVAISCGGGNGGTFQWRSQTGANSSSSRTLSGISPPAYIRLVRRGDTFTGYIFLNGQWQQQGQTATVPMTDPVYIGLAVTSHLDGVLCTAVFDNVVFGDGVDSDLQTKMLDINSSLWARVEFTVEDPDMFDALTLRMKYEDGFAAYLNGQQIARRNAPDLLEWDSTAASDRPIEQASFFEDINLMAFLGLLQAKPNKNVLAIHGLNDNKADGEFLILPELVAAGNVTVPQYFTTATPGTFNVAGAIGIVDDVWFSHERGLYDNPFQLILSTEAEDAEIRYTLDGSRPTITHGTVYSGPVTVDGTTTVRAVSVKPGFLDSKVKTHTYVFLDEVIRQPALPDGFPANWAHTGVGEYEMDPDVVDNPLYRDTIKDDLKSVPTFSLVMDVDDWFKSGGQGIYIQGERDERAVSAELIFPDGSPGFQIDCAVMIVGGTSPDRWKMDKLSMRLKFQRQYGDPKLRFPLFGNEATDEFDTLVVDARMNNSWAYGGGVMLPNNSRPWIAGRPTQRDVAQYTRDQFVSDIQNAAGGYAPRGRHVHLYLNGLYWGLYWIHERPDEHFAAAYLGGEDEDYDVLKHNSGTVINGSGADYNEMFNIANSGLNSDEQYQLIQDYLDIPDFIDYMITNFYVGNTDWAHQNWYATRSRVDPSGRWRYHSWDAEHVMEALDADVTGKNDSGGPTRLQQRLAQNSDYRMLFADHVHRHFFNDGVLTPQRAKALYRVRLDEVDRAVVGESARWGDNHQYTPRTRDIDWLRERDWLLNVYFPQRTAIVLNQLKARGWYPNIDAPVFYINGSYKHGGYTLPGDMFSMTATVGTIYYTLDGSDPHLPAGSQGTTLVAENAAKRVLVPTSPTDDDWKGGQPFDDSAWIPCNGAAGGVGYERTSGYEHLISLDVETQMYGENATCYIRIPFSVEALELNQLTLKVRYDDGFIAYLNGTEVARRNFTGTPTWNAHASTSYSDSLAVEFENIDISSHVNALREGDNVLAMQGLNASTTSSDFLICAELIAGQAYPGDVSPRAIEYTGPVTLTDTTRVKARVWDGSTWSALNEAVFAVGPVANCLRITEIMYHPRYAGDPNDPNEEFVELKNIGTEPLNLNLVSFTEGIHFTFGSLELGAGEYAIVVQDRDAFEAQYGAGLNIAGQYTGRLDNAGERIKLEDALGRTILEFRYSDGWHDMTDGQGFSLTIIEPSHPDPSSWGQKDAWRASAVVGGSPGWDDTGFIPNPGSIVINEVLAHSHAETPDWIELHNTTSEPISIGGWFLSDSDKDDASRMKYRIAEGTTIDPYGCVVFYEDLHFGHPNDPGCIVPFALSANGDEVVLSSAEGDMLTGYREAEEFDASETGVSFGRYYKESTGNFNFVAMSENTPWLPNAYPKVGPIIINEFMYNPDPFAAGSYDHDEFEYVELYNISDSPVTLFNYTVNAPWKFTDGIEYTFPGDPPVTIPAGEYLLVVKNPEAFAWRYPGVPIEKILGPYDGKLKNGGEKLEISMPGEVDELGTLHYIRIDRVNYSDGSHPEDCPGGVDLWPPAADGGGLSLARKVPSDYGNDVINWQGALPSPGAVNP